MSWIDHHVRTFAEPYLREMGAIASANALRFTPERLVIHSGRAAQFDLDVLHSFVKGSLRAVSRLLNGRILLLLGRDVWLWEVMARKMRVKTIFDPRVSRTVANSLQFKELWHKWPLDKCVMFDTGFAGSIYRALLSQSGISTDTFPCVLASTPMTLCRSLRGKEERSQIFPNHKGSRGKALALEYVPKYWKSGTVKEGEVMQFYSETEEFAKAAALTIDFWHRQSPRRVPKMQ